MLIIASRHYLGYRYFNQYKSIRAAAKSVERSFPELEGTLLKAIRFSKNPAFFQELGRLYFERAVAENNSGAPERREFYLDRAREAFSQQIERNPFEAIAYYDLGNVYMLYNFPLLVTTDKARASYRKAVEFNPANEFLNLNVLTTFLMQWSDLGAEEKTFVFRQLAKMAKDYERFLVKLKRQWLKNTGNEAGLKEILELDSALWEKAKKYF